MTTQGISGDLHDPLLIQLVRQRELIDRERLLAAARSSLRRLLRSTGASFAIVLAPAPRGLRVALAVGPPDPPATLTEAPARDPALRAWCQAAALTMTEAPLETDAEGRVLVVGGPDWDAEAAAAPIARAAERLSLGLLAAREGGLDAETQAEVLARLSGCPRADRTHARHAAEGLGIPKGLILRTRVLPLRRSPAGLEVAVADPFDFSALEDFEAAAGAPISARFVASAPELEAALARLGDDPLPQLAALTRSPSAEPSGASSEVIELVEALITRASQAGASDLHIEAGEDAVVVRQRVDGLCRIVAQLPKALQSAIVNRIKILAELKITERRLPQDGRIPATALAGGLALDLRVSVTPSLHGESVVMRLIRRGFAGLSLPELGFSEAALGRYEAMLQAPYGMILHVGPTGSGKSVSMFSALATLNSPELKIVTAEDPVEVRLPGATQVEVQDAIGLSFASALRCFLRQDPDIILVGEIRDEETARVAVEAALTGHKLFSTLHTNDAASTITRLLEIGVLPYLVCDAVLGICAQRLVRRLCSCRAPVALSEAERALVAGAGPESPATLWRPVGCERCDGAGRKGRVGIYELMEMTDPLRAVVLRSGATQELAERARAQGMRTLVEEGLRKVGEGACALGDVLRSVRISELPEGPALLELAHRLEEPGEA